MTDFIAMGPACSDEGWFLTPAGSRAHHMKKVHENQIDGTDVVLQMWEADCGRTFTASNKIPMFEPGNYPRCANCEAAQRRAMTRKAGRAA